jgi:hypothetical protein
MRKLSLSVGMIPVDFASYFWAGGKSKSNDNKQERTSVIPLKKHVKQGYFYGAYRVFMGDIPDIEEYLIVLMLRDPRDVLVSTYFSSAYSHGMPKHNSELKQKMITKRKEVLQMTIDEFVLKHALGTLHQYQEYVQNCLHRPNVLFLQYENMVSDFEEWMQKLLMFLELDVPQEIVDQIISEADFTVQEENIHAHKRQVTPGDHKRKLKPETVRELNKIFSDVLRELDYAL